MYLGIDIGGTKTLVASLDEGGTIQEKLRFSTPKDYPEFLRELDVSLKQLPTKGFITAGVGMPGTLDRERGIGLWFGNLPWQNVPVQTDIAALTECPVVVENDAKLAGLSEATLLKDNYDKVLYVTISTGIGMALIKDGIIETDFGDGGGRAMMLEYHDKVVPWESFASGKAIVERFGKKASEITDEATWGEITEALAIGFVDLIGFTQPDAVVIGGSVGTYFDKYKDFLEAAIKKYQSPLVPIPPLLEAQRPEEAVIYGCYELARQKHEQLA